MAGSWQWSRVTGGRSRSPLQEVLWSGMSYSPKNTVSFMSVKTKECSAFLTKGENTMSSCNVQLILSQNENFSQSHEVSNTHDLELRLLEGRTRGRHETTSCCGQLCGWLLVQKTHLPSQCPASQPSTSRPPGQQRQFHFPFLSSKVIFFKQYSLLLLLSCGSPEDYMFLSMKASV